MAYLWRWGVGRVLVQLDDELVRQLDKLALALGVSRSELLRRSAQAVLSAADIDEADQQLAAAYRRVPPDAALTQSALRLAAETAPSW
jgi:metal-responsive CopG/Arc/MetJ family transcriptional regulator